MIEYGKKNAYDAFNHAKTRLRYHIIFCTKYGRKCLNPIRDVVIESFREAERRSHFKIHHMELDEDHIHFLVSFPPKYSIEQTVSRMKQFSVKYVYDDMNANCHLRKFYWRKKKTL